MTPEQEQLEAQSRAAIKAWCDDPSVQLDYCHQTYMDWRSMLNSSVFDLSNYYYRIAQPKKWYRVAKMRLSTGREYPDVDNSEMDDSLRNQPGFIEWLDERKYYD